MASSAEPEDEEVLSSTGSVELTNLPPDVDDDYIILYFDDEENCRKSIEIKHVFLDKSLKSAVIELKDPDDVEKIDGQSFEMEGQTVKGQRFILSAVEVIGPQDIVIDKNKSKLTMHFKSAKRSGGGPIVDLKLIQPGKAMIKYSSEDIARNVVKWKNHTFMNKALEVKLYHPKRYKSKTLLISDLPDSVDEEFLEYYFEDEDIFETSSKVKAELHEAERFAYMRFERITDLEMVLDHLPLVMEEQEVKVEWCSLEDDLKATSESRTLSVKGPASTINTENENVLKQYFKQSLNTSGDVIITFTNDPGVANVTFESEEDARQVVLHTSHVLQSQQLDIKMFKEQKEDEILDDQNKKTDSKQQTTAEKECCKIEVLDLPPAVDEYFLELYFDKEAEVVAVKMHPEKSSAIIEFQEPEAVERLVQKQTFTIKDHTVTVEKYCPKEDRTCTIKVTGKDMTPYLFETLRMYFSNERKSGGGNIIQNISDGNAAYFKFENENVAIRVLKKDHSRQGIIVELYKGDMPKNEDKTHPTPEHAQDKTDLSNTASIKATGIHSSSTRETITLYFENTKRSGGDKVVEIMDDMEDSNVKYVKFENHEVAKRAASKTHSIDGHELDVSLYVPPPYDDKKILVRGIAEQTSKDSLMNFLEAKSTIKPISVSYHAELMDVALVTMEHKPDFGKLEKACSKSKLEGEYLKLSRVPFSNCIWVGNLAPDVTKETVHLYFENKKGGGGDVEKVSMIPDEEAGLVYFEDYKVIDDVVTRKHQLSGRQLSVKRYALCLGCPEGDSERKLKLPDPIDIETNDSYKLQFLIKSDYRHHVENELLKKRVHVSWPSEQMTSIRLECDVKRNEKGASLVIKSWKENVMAAFESLLTQIIEIDVPVFQNIWERAENYQKGMTLSNPKEVIVVRIQDRGMFKLVGKTDAANALRQEIEEALAGLVKDLSKVKEDLKFIKHLDLQLLIKMNVIQEIGSRYPDLNTDVNMEESKITLEGSLSSVRDAKLYIYEKSGQFFPFTCGNLSAVSLELYGCPETRNVIDAKLKKEGENVVWMVEGGDIVLCCSDRKLQQQCLRTIRESVQETSLNIKEFEIPNLKTTVWQNEVEDIQRSYAGKASVTVSSDSSEIIVCATDDIINAVTDQIHLYIKNNSIIVETIDCETDIILLLERHHKNEITAVSKGHEKEYIQVNFDNEHQRIEVKGLEKGAKHAMGKIKEILKKVKIQNYSMTRPGLSDYLKTRKGKENLEQIETLQPCRIKIVGQDDSSTPDVIASYKAGSRHIVATVCDITEKVVGLILNPSDENLQLLGGLGRAIASKGGQSINDACAKHGQLNDMEIFITDGGNLKTQYVAHFKSDEWKGGKNKEKENLTKAILLCLIQANALNLKSVAIPAVGCGVNGFPVQTATSAIVDGVRKFYLEKQDSCVETVYLCDTENDKVQGFANAMCSVFGRNNVRITSDEQSRPTTNEVIPVQTVSGGRTKASKRGKAKTTVTPTASKTSNPSPNTKRKASSQQKNISIKLIKGELAKEQVDVIVNTTSQDLILTNGRASASLLQAAGQGLQAEVTAKYPDGLKTERIAVSAGHNLRCKHVFHTSLPTFDKQKPDISKQILKDSIVCCLDKTEDLDLSSISFPAIGTGNLGYPRDIVAEVMYSTVAEFSRQHSPSLVKEVHFVVFPGDAGTVTAFEQEDSRLTADPTASQDWIAVDAPSADDSSGVYMFGSFGVCAKIGDRLQEDIECIVNDTNESGDFKRGMFSKQLVSKCGKMLVEELDNIQKEMQTNSIGFTKAPTLPCKYIIHVVSTPKTVSDAVEKCLKLAERLRVKSIGFPAMCTESTKWDQTEIAKEMMKGMKEFGKTKTQHLKDVRILISQSDSSKLGVYQAAVEKASDAKAPKTWKRSILSYLGFGGSNDDKSDESEPAEIEVKEQSARPTDSVTFKIYALKKSVIDQVKQKINTCLEGETMTKTFDDGVIALLDDNQVHELECMIRQRKIQVEIDRDIPHIKITGIKDNIHVTSDIVHTFLKDVSEMNLMVHVVQWFVIIVGEESEDVEPYEKTLNIRIERAYKKKDRAFTYYNSDDDEQYVIDFEKMEEYPQGDPEDTARVLRRDYVNSSFVCDEPHNWDDMKGGKLRVVMLDKQGSEYKDIESKFLESSSPEYKCTVEKIERVQNRTLWVQYQSKKKEMDEVNIGQTNERFLWHGTDEATVDSVNVHGFNRSYCGKNATLHGDGVYFAVFASYSCRKQYSVPDANNIKRIYYCRVLTGDFMKGASGMRVPPPNKDRGKHCVFNSVVDDMDENKREMFVIFHDAQAYPEYLIYFKVDN